MPTKLGRSDLTVYFYSYFELSWIIKIIEKSFGTVSIYYSLLSVELLDNNKKHWLAQSHYVSTPVKSNTTLCKTQVNSNPHRSCCNISQKSTAELKTVPLFLKLAEQLRHNNDQMPTTFHVAMNKLTACTSQVMNSPSSTLALFLDPVCSIEVTNYQRQKTRLDTSVNWSRVL